MKSFKRLLNELSNDSSLRQLTNDEKVKLRKVFLQAYIDLNDCCEKNDLTLMLIGGTALGAVRHKGFIPWDDDLDVAMPRSDFEKLKKIFEKELGDRYILSAPNYMNNAKNRFPMMLVKDTLLVEADSNPDDCTMIKIDIFIIENIPDGLMHKLIKGLWCSAIMAMGSYEETYEHQNEFFKNYMCKTREGKKAYQRRIFLGKIFSFYSFQKWMNIIDNACQYKKETGLMGIPSGRGHFFGEICSRETFLPTSNGEFEGIIVKLPGSPHLYISNLYGEDYMTLPPVKKREKHFIVDIKFKGE